MWLLGLKGLKERRGKTWPFTSSSVRSNATSWDSYIRVRISFVDLIWNFCNWLVHTYSTLSKTIFCVSVRFNLAVNPVKYSFLLSQFSHVTYAQSFLTVTTETTTSKFCCFNWIESTIMEKKEKESEKRIQLLLKFRTKDFEEEPRWRRRAFKNFLAPFPWPLFLWNHHVKWRTAP